MSERNIERTGKRDQTFSDIMRLPGASEENPMVSKLGFRLRSCDVDVSPVCDVCGKYIALFEETRGFCQVKGTRYTRNLADAAGLPAFLIEYLLEDFIERFVVTSLQTTEQIEFLSKKAFVNWVEGLYLVHQQAKH